MPNSLARLTDDFQWHMGEGVENWTPTRRLEKNTRYICPQNIACKKFSGYTHLMTLLGFLMMYDGNYEDLFKIICICFVMDMALNLYFVWAITKYRMWIVYLINLILDVPYLTAEKKMSNWDRTTYICTLFPDVYWLVFSLLVHVF